ncbi:MAG: methylenetetrahydrofolate reductase [bacterium]|nr:methylenetetrahydrofolate reductase [bacterium]
MGANDQVSVVERARRGEFVTSIQLDPPNGGTTCEDLFRFATDLAGNGWTTFDVNSTRRPLAVSALTIAARLQAAGHAVIPHITARDALVRGILSDIRSAYELFHLRDILVVRGDPAEDEPATGREGLRTPRGVFEVEVPDLVDRISRDVRAGCGATDLRIGVAYTLPPPHDACVTTGVKEEHAERERLSAKFTAGADFAMTQPVFRTEDWLRVRASIDRDTNLRDRPYLVGLWPIFDQRTLTFLTERGCDGVFFPRQLREQYDRHAPSDWGRISMDACESIVAQLQRDGTAAGAYIVTPFRKGLWPQFLELLRKIRP